MNVENSESLPARISAALAQQIIRGELKPGDRIRQDAVASEFQASHVPVREAFRRLEARGLVVSRERKGVYVPLLDQASIVEITRMRAALEVLALRHAMPHLSLDDISLAQESVDQAYDCHDISSWEEANRRFHTCLYKPCDMPRLLTNIHSLHEARLRYMYATARVIDWNLKSEQEHVRILNAVKARDLVAACNLLEQHIEDSGEILLQAMAKLVQQ